jgi:alpha-beta hydrolase superfamily lysophospholipase
MTAKTPFFILLLCCLVLLTACPPRFTPPHNPALATPELKETSFISFDGTELPLRTWLPRDGVNGIDIIMVAVHGFNDYSSFITGPARYFTEHRIGVYAYDQRGFGRAPVRGLWSSTDAMARDLKTLVRLLARKHPDLPIYLLGHSMGGAVIIQAMAGDNQPEVSGAILAAPAVWARSTAPFYQYASLWLVAHTIPWYTVTGEILARTSCSNSEALKELGRDPQVIKETRFDTIYGLQNLMDEAYGAADRYTLKTLVLYGLHDEIIPKEPVLDAFRRFPAASGALKQLILYEEGYHMLLRDLQAENVMEDIVAWINNRPTGSKAASY